MFNDYSRTFKFSFRDQARSSDITKYRVVPLNQAGVLIGPVEQGRLELSVSESSAASPLGPSTDHWPASFSAAASVYSLRSLHIYAVCIAKLQALLMASSSDKLHVNGANASCSFCFTHWDLPVLLRQRTDHRI